MNRKADSSLKGKIKQATGDLTNNPHLHDEGVADEVAENTQDAVGRARRKVGEAVEDVGTGVNIIRRAIEEPSDRLRPTRVTRARLLCSA